MKQLVTLAVALLAAGASAAQPQVGVSVSVVQPGVYGRIDIGNAPPPVVYAQPIVIRRAPVVVQQAPVYLYAPPGHQKNWAKHCGRYNACGQPVYFVQESWVHERYQSEHPGDHGHKHGKKDKKHKHGHD